MATEFLSVTRQRLTVLVHIWRRHSNHKLHFIMKIWSSDMCMFRLWGGPKQTRTDINLTFCWNAHKHTCFCCHVMSVAFELACVKPEDVNAVLSEKQRKREREWKQPKLRLLEPSRPKMMRGQLWSKVFSLLPAFALLASCFLLFLLLQQVICFEWQ